MTQPVIFISYSHKDEREKDRLLSHLGILRHQGLIDLWSDDRIGAGADWQQEIKKAMAQARVAILLISANFLTSDFILGGEVPTLLKRRKSEGLIVFPVIVKACAWQEMDWLTSMNVRPKNGRPIWGAGSRRVDEDLTDIAKEVAAIVKIDAPITATTSGVYGKSPQTEVNTFKTAGLAFLDTIPTSKESTRQTYAAALGAFNQFLEQAADLSPDTPLIDYPEKVLLNFFLWLDKRGYSSFTLNTYLAALRRFFLFHYTARNLGPQFDIVRAQDLLKGKLKVHYPQTRAPEGLPNLVVYFDQQPLPLLDGTKDTQRQRLCLLRDRAILHTLYATAGRVSEVAALTRHDVAEGDTDEVLITGKGDKERWLYLTPEALAAIRAYLAERADYKTGLFVSHGRDSGKRLSRTSLWRVVKRAAEAVGLPDVSPHTFRHWRATQMLNDEVSLEIIQELLGHSDIGTTRKVYAKSKRQRIKDAFLKHSPSPHQAMENNDSPDSSPPDEETGTS